MDPFALPLLALLLHTSIDALLALGRLFEPLLGMHATVAAVILVTLLVRAALLPFGVAQTRAELGRERLAPQAAAIARRHPNDPERRSRETLELYRRAGVSPWGGCLPVLLQAPVLGLLYALFLHPVVDGAPNPLLEQTLAGVPLGAGLWAGIGAGSVTLPLVLVTVALAAITLLAGEFARRHRMRGVDAAPGTGVLGVILAQTTTAILLFVPVGAGIYLAVTAVWTPLQRAALRRILARRAQSASE